ncbi:MAG TPA: S66 peptidase family protein [Candidatus Paceibacterota bacterium]
MYPERLKKGDKIVVIAPSNSWSFASEEVGRIARERFSDMGIEVSFSKNVNETDEFDSSSIESRISDLHAAFSDKSVKGIIAAYGGFNTNQLLRHLDWKLIKKNPKVLIGYSDITALQNAIYAKTGLVTYSGPLYSTFGQKLYFDYTLEHFKKCVLEDGEFGILASATRSDDGWLADQDKRKLLKNDGWLVINEGSAKGRILGGNICTINLLQGTEYMPDIAGSILFLEDDADSKAVNFDRDLQSILHLPDFRKVKGLVIGRFQTKSAITDEQLIKIIKTKKELENIPVLANVDFGHSEPMITYPIGGEAELVVSKERSVLRIIKH